MVNLWLHCLIRCEQTGHCISSSCWYRIVIISLHWVISLITRLLITWACLQFHELACSPMILHAVQWPCMLFHELACRSLTRHAGPLAMSFHVLAWISMSLPAVQKLVSNSVNYHAVPWTIMQFHTVPYFHVLAAHKNFTVLI